MIYSDLSTVNHLFEEQISNRIKLSPFNNSYIATCSYLAKIWKISEYMSWELIRTYTDQHSVYDLEWINEDLVASGSWNNNIKIWTISTGKTERTITYHLDFVLCLKLLDKSNLLAAGNVNFIDIFNINDGSLVLSLQGVQTFVYSLVQLSFDLLSSSGNGEVLIWNLTANSTIFTLQGHTSSVTILKQINSEILASGSDDSTIILWNITSGELIRTLTGHSGFIGYSIDLSNDGQTLVSGDSNGIIKTWNWSTGECLNTIQMNTNIRALAVIDWNQQTTTQELTSKIRINILVLDQIKYLNKIPGS